jgi:pimeloyl-ACP methyl ester carboxylesterase
MRTLVGDAVGLLDALGVDRAAVVGHDWGAALAWMVAMFAPDRVSRLVAVSVGHPVSFADVDLGQKQRSWYMLWFQFPGVAERVLPEHDWAVFRRWAWNGAGPGQDPDCDRQVAELSRPGALTAGLNWYRANVDPATFIRSGPIRSSLPPVACPTMGVWSTDDFAVAEAQMTGSQRFVTGPWHYRRLEGVSHWVPVHAPQALNRLLVDFLR